MWTPSTTEPRRRYDVVVVLLACGALVTGCGHDPPARDDAGAAATIRVTSTAFADGGAIPVELTCDGQETSPPLAWSGGGDGAAEPAAWALVVDDPDAPGGTFVHWVVLDVPVATRSVAAGEVPDGAVQAMNTAGSASYAGPCPPSGTHHYRFTVYGLSAPVDLAEGASTQDALDGIRAEAESRGTLVGTYARSSS